MVVQLALKQTNQDVINQAIQQLQQGRDNASGVVQLRAGNTTTPVASPNCSNTSCVLMFPATADAAAAVPTTYVLQSNVQNGQFTISHVNAASTDRYFYWRICGGY